MECPRCGAYNPEGAAFCDLCLHSFGPEGSEEPPLVPAGSPLPSQAGASRTAASSPQAELPLPPGAHSPSPVGQADTTKRSKAIKWISLSLVIAIVLVVGGIFGYKYLIAGKSHVPKNLSVLFVGNSYTFVNDLPGTLSQIAQSLGDKLDYDSSAIGGYTFQQHVSDQNTISKIGSKKWDAVVLQEQSQVPAVYTEAEKAQYITPYARILDSMIHQANPSARTVFFETWGRKSGDSQFVGKIPGVGSYDGDQARINATYEQLSSGLSATLAPVGKVWSLIRQTHPEIELYQSDGSHPSGQGTYLAACVFYDVLFGGRATGAKSSLTVEPVQAKILQEAANQTVAPPVNQTK
jgi:hypothetical protein